MAVVNNYENVVARSSTGEIRNAPTYKRTFTVRCDNPDTSMVDVANAPGIKYGDPHPHDASCFVTNVDVDADGDSMLIYTVSYLYTRPVNDLSVTGGVPSSPEGGSYNPPDPLAIPEGYWSGGSTLETRQNSTTRGFVQARVNFDGVPIKMTNGRPLTSGVVMDFASEQLVMQNYYAEWKEVENLALNVDRMNGGKWPLDATNAWENGPMAWKVVGFNWSFKQQSSGQQRLEYFEVQVTFKRNVLWKYNPAVHDLQGWPPNVVANLQNGKAGIPSTIPMLASAGFQELIYPKLPNGQENLNAAPIGLTAIQSEIIYRNCAGEPVPNPNGNQDPNSTEVCEQFQVTEPTTEEVPLSLKGKAVPRNTTGAVVVPWTEEYPLVPFDILFGKGPPHKPSPTTFPPNP